jgi:hypothetical protein
MRKYERVPLIVLAQKFTPPAELGKDHAFIKQNKKQGWWITQHHSYCPTTDEYRGTYYKLMHESVIADIKPGDYIVVIRGRVTAMSPEEFKRDFALV